MSNSHYDVLIVGAGIAGCALAHALSTVPRSKPFRIALLERSLSEPDRIVGELLQPGGVLALRKLGIESCVDGIDAIPVHGYCVVESGRSVQIPYPGTHEGRSFHHGRFVMKLREAAGSARGVDVIEASATELIERERRVIGVRATRKTNVSLGEPSSNGLGDTTGSDTVKEEFFADLVVAADGCFSNFRTAVMGSAMAKSTTKSHFIGAVLEDARLPIPQHGTVALIKGYGPVLLYQIGEHDTRMLVDVKVPLPSDLQVYLSSLSSSRKNT
jgi:squalene monooxygenase